MHRQITVLLVALALGLVFTTRAIGQIDVAVQDIKNLLRNKGIDRPSFPQAQFNPASFDPNQFDPLMLEAIWNTVRTDVQQILRRRLQVEVFAASLKLYVSKVSQASSIDSRGRTVTSTRYKVVFLEPNRNIRSVLMQALSLPPECFPNYRQVHETRQISARDMTVEWSDIGTVTSNFVGSSPKVRQQGFVTRAPVYVGNDKVQVFTSWRQYRRVGGYDMLWRLFFQVKKGDQPSTYLVSVRGQVGRRLPGAHVDTTEYVGTDEHDSRFEVPLGEPSIETTSNFVASTPNEGPPPQPPSSVSNSAQLAHDLLDDYLALLTRE